MAYQQADTSRWISDKDSININVFYDKYLFSDVFDDVKWHACFLKVEIYQISSKGLQKRI